MEIQKGFILVSSLLFLLMLSLLTMAVLTRLNLERKIANNAYGIVQEFYAAEAGLIQAEQTVCTIAPQEIFHRQFNHAGYRVAYQIEPMSVSACIKSKNRCGYFYRITAQAQLSGEKPQVIQSHYVCLGQERCRKKDRSTRLGRSSWRAF
jgi:hypothetical protein